MPAQVPASTGQRPPRSPLPRLARVRGTLAADRDRAVRRLGELQESFEELVAASVNSNSDDEHDPEGTTIAFERSQLSAVVRQVRLHLEEIDAATTRIAERRYGVCEICGQPIAADRLLARPVARACMRCASHLDGSTREN